LKPRRQKGFNDRNWKNFAGKVYTSNGFGGVTREFLKRQERRINLPFKNWC